MTALQRLTCRLIALAAALVLAAPGVSLPCLGAGCAVVAPDETDPPPQYHDCCANRGTPESNRGEPAGDERPASGGPCDCPPGCPASCCSVKLPVPPIEPGKAVAGLSPAGVLVAPACDCPTDASPVGIFRPPRQ